MTEVWHDTKLGDFIELKRGYDLPKSKRVIGEVPIISSSGLSGNHHKAKVLAPGVVTGRYGTIGEVFFVSDDFWPLNTTLYVRDFKGSDPRFVSYFLRTINFLAYSDKAAVPGVNRNHLHEAEIRVPDTRTQKKIAGVLSSLDDKIELNRQTNETLEAMARALFRDWFIDFGPTRRQMAGATDPVEIMGRAFPNTGKAVELAALFPKTLGGDGLPAGWKKLSLGKIANFLNGLAMQKFPAEKGQPDLPVIKIAELRNGITSKSNRASTAVPEKYQIRNGDFIFSWSGSLMAKFWTGGSGALNQHLFKVTSESHPMWFISEWVQTHLEEFQRIAASKAVTMGHIKRSHLSEAMCTCPPDTSSSLLDGVFDPLIAKQISNEMENQTLAALRDLLLPKLMSGEITLKDVKKLT